MIAWMVSGYAAAYRTPESIFFITAGNNLVMYLLRRGRHLLRGPALRAVEVHSEAEFEAGGARVRRQLDPAVPEVWIVVKSIIKGLVDFYLE